MIKEYLTERELADLALFLKRVCFDHVLDCTDGNDDKAQAYRMIDAIVSLQKLLADLGYNPR